MKAYMWHRIKLRSRSSQWFGVLFYDMVHNSHRIEKILHSSVIVVPLLTIVAEIIAQWFFFSKGVVKQKVRNYVLGTVNVLSRDCHLLALFASGFVLTCHLANLNNQSVTWRSRGSLDKTYWLLIRRLRVYIPELLCCQGQVLKQDP